MLEALGVSKRFGERHALCGVDFIAEPGELHGLLGPNGAGKTTLMRVWLGLVRRDAGIVRVFGREVDSAARPLPEGVAGCVEQPAFYPYLSGRRNLELLARLDGLTGSMRDARVTRVLEETNLASRADLNVGGYSAGMRQLLALAAALLRSPRLLFLDEPTSALDPAAARDVRRLASDLASDGAAVVFSSHDMAEVESLCRRVTMIDRGRVVFSGTVDEMRHLTPRESHALRTSDDHAALDIATRSTGVTITLGVDGCLEIAGETAALDAYAIALGRAGIAIRVLERRTRSIESAYLELSARTTMAAT